MVKIPGKITPQYWSNHFENNKSLKYFKKGLIFMNDDVSIYLKLNQIYY